MIYSWITRCSCIILIDRISNHTASSRCNARQFGSRLSIEHDILMEPFDKKVRAIVSSVLKEDLMKMAQDLSFSQQKMPHDWSKDL